MLSELIDKLACPVCKGHLTLSNGNSSLLCRHCSTLYPVRDGIPVLLIDEGVKIGDR